MPRRELLTPAERESLLAIPVDETERIRHYTLSRSDLGFIRQHRRSELERLEQRRPVASQLSVILADQAKEVGFAGGGQLRSVHNACGECMPWQYRLDRRERIAALPHRSSRAT